ncbi:MAG: hypothetical protein RIS47_823, partial [Bacteroidota bacterium]
PTLVFENYSVFQALYQQNLSTGEYEFVFDALEDGKIGFVSKTDLGPNKTKMYFYSAVGDEIDKVKVKQAQIRGLSQFITVVDADNPSVKMGLVFNTDGTATLNTLKGEETTSQTFDYFATVEGLGFMPALSFGGKLLGELFKYDDVKKAFVSVDNSKVSIVEGMTPPLPLPAYTIGARAYAAYNYLDAYKSSLAFSEFYTAFAANMKANGLEITSWSLQDLKLPVSYLSIKTKGGNFWFDFTREVKEDGKVYLTLTGDNNAGEKLTYMQPLIDILFDTNGLYYFASGKLAAYSNKTFSIISAADPHIKIDFYEGGS